MATISITVPDAIVPQIIACLRNLYPQYGPDGENLTDAQLFKRVVANQIRELYTNWTATQARTQVGPQVAQQVAQAQTDTAGIG